MHEINPQVLIWARETAGLGLGEAAAKLGIAHARGLTGEERLWRLESGEDKPSRPLLVKMAKQYRRPLLLFYMSKTPRIASRGTDFRTLTNDYSPTDDALVGAVIRKVQARQGIVRTALELEEDGMPLAFVGSFEMNLGVLPLVASITKTIGYDVQQFRKQATPFEAFGWLRARVEAAGIFVLLIGDLGSHHTAIPPEVFRGFALADPIAPFVIINDKDAESAWSFTLIHELAHLWLGQTGLDNTFADNEIEQFCNRVAGEILLPNHELDRLKLNDTLSFDSLMSEIAAYSFERNLSSSMVAYSLYLEGRIDHSTWHALSQYYKDMWLKIRAEKKQKARDAGGGANYYSVRRHRLGNGLVSLVQRLAAGGSLSTTKAAQILDVKAVNVTKLFDAGST
jgi:Zn-dependent peptidase ImmA (M78 family)